MVARAIKYANAHDPLHCYERWLEVEKELPIMEIPLIIQDGAMLNPAKGMRLDEDTAFQYIKQITEGVEKVGGVLTLLWHPNYIIKPDWWDLYLRTLEYLKGKNAWFGSVREVGGQAIWPQIHADERRYSHLTR